MRVEYLQRFLESVFTAVKLVARFWRSVDSVLNTEKHVRSMLTFVESDLTADRLVGGF